MVARAVFIDRDGVINENNLLVITVDMRAEPAAG